MKSVWYNFKELLTNVSDSLGLAWWVEIVTQNPKCTYYFGPFYSPEEAKIAQKGYVEDLEFEGAVLTGVEVKRCKPGNLTVEELGERLDRQIKPAFGGQV